MNRLAGIPAALTILAFAGLTPITALAAGRGNYPLTQAELELIDVLPSQPHRVFL